MNVVEEQQWAAAEARPTSRQASRASCASYASYASAVRMQSTVPRRRTQGDSTHSQWCSGAVMLLVCWTRTGLRDSWEGARPLWEGSVRLPGTRCLSQTA